MIDFNQNRSKLDRNSDRLLDRRLGIGFESYLLSEFVGIQIGIVNDSIGTPKSPKLNTHPGPNIGMRPTGWESSGKLIKIMILVDIF